MSTLETDGGRSPSGSGYSAEPEPSCAVSAVPVSIPNTDPVAVALLEKYAALTGEREALITRTAEVERLIRACSSAARALGVPFPNAGLARKTITSLVSEALEDAGQAGATVVEMRPQIEEAYGIPMHPKSIGVALQRMAVVGTARNKGRRWFSSLAEQPK